MRLIFVILASPKTYTRKGSPDGHRNLQPAENRYARKPRCGIDPVLQRLATIMLYGDLGQKQAERQVD